jgi:tetratricopeptide (TPR) repeat protein
LNNLAEGYRAVGQLKLALPLYEETLKLGKANLGPDHPHTLTYMNNLAIGYTAAGRLDKALPLFEETLKLRKAKLGPDHPDTLSSMSNLASGYHAAGKLDLALPLYEETLKLRKAKLGPNHPHTLTTMSNLAVAYLNTKQPEKGLALVAEFVSIQRQRLGANDLRFAGLLASISYELLKVREFGDAEKLLREALAIRVKSQPDTWPTFYMRSMLGGALLGQKKYTDAEVLLKEGYNGMKAQEKNIPAADLPRLTEALERLVQLYEATGNTTEAEHWRKELAERQAAQKEAKK